MTVPLLLILGLFAAPAQLEQSRQRIADERVVFRTVAGDFVVVLYPEVAPGHVQRFLELRDWASTTPRTLCALRMDPSCRFPPPTTD